MKGAPAAVLMPFATAAGRRRVRERVRECLEWVC